MRTAIVGLGDIAFVHLDAIKNDLELTTLVAACDLDLEKKSLVEGIPFYTNVEEMLDKENIDVLHICLPHHLHYPIAKLAASKGVNVFCEKPLALNEKEATDLASLEKIYPNVKIGLCLQNRFNTCNKFLYDIVKSKKEGNVLSIKGLVAWHRTPEYYKVKPWRGMKELAGGGVMINQSIHTLDLIQLLGGEIESIKGTVANISNLDIEVEDTANAVINFKNGAHGMFFATNANGKNSSVEITVTFENGVEYVMRDLKLKRVSPNGNVEIVAEDERFEGIKFYYGASHSRVMKAFYLSVLNNTNDYISASEGIISNKMIDAIIESSETNKKVIF